MLPGPSPQLGLHPAIPGLPTALAAAVVRETQARGGGAPGLGRGEHPGLRLRAQPDQSRGGRHQLPVRASEPGKKLCSSIMGI